CCHPFNTTAITQLYTLSLHDALPISSSIKNAGCGRFRTKVTPSSPSVVTSSRLRYQALRGLRRSFSLDLPSSMSQVHLTSFAVKDRKSTRLNSSHRTISYAVFCLKKK